MQEGGALRLEIPGVVGSAHRCGGQIKRSGLGGHQGNSDDKLWEVT